MSSKVQLDLIAKSNCDAPCFKKRAVTTRGIAGPPGARGPAGTTSWTDGTSTVTTTKTVVAPEITLGGVSILTGTGVPSASAPNGSLFLRTDGTGPNLYVRENGAWVAK